MQTHLQVSLFITGAVLLLCSVFFHARDKHKQALFFLLSAALCYFLFAALLCPYLNVWDERFHALVAKNLMHHPLMPTLYDHPVVNMAYNGWDRAHIWLHKQPLFLWQIALSFGIFGVSEFTLRLPGVLLACMFVYAGYRSGKLLGNERIAYYTGLLIVTSFYLMQLVSGRQMLGQNDVSFLAYVSFSIWAFIEYLHSRNRWWLLAIGCFSGFAILCKWLTGLLIYLIWGVYAVSSHRMNLRKYGDMLAALFITTLVALPWQLFILKWYPVQAHAAYRYNTLHFFVPVEGHGGNLFYHFNKMGTLFGAWVPWLIIPALGIMYKKMQDKKLWIAILVSILFVYVLFSFADTKMPSFTLIVALPMYLAIAFLIDYLLGLFDSMFLSRKVKMGIIFLFTLVLAYSRFDLSGLKKNYGFMGKMTTCEQIWVNNKKIFKRLHLPSNAVIFNIKGRHYVEAMFYTGLPAYNFIPTKAQYEDLKQKDKIIALFMPDNGQIPAYLKNDKQLIKLNEKLGLCE